MNGSQQGGETDVAAGAGSHSGPPRLLDQVRARIRARHYSLRTEKSYVDWIRRFILFHGKRHPRGMEGPEVEAFLTSLAVDRQVASSTQNQAWAAILFFYRELLDQELPCVPSPYLYGAPPRRRHSRSSRSSERRSQPPWWYR